MNFQSLEKMQTKVIFITGEDNIVFYKLSTEKR